MVPQGPESGGDSQQPDPESIEHVEKATEFGNQECNERGDDPEPRVSPRDLWAQALRLPAVLPGPSQDHQCTQNAYPQNSLRFLCLSVGSFEQSG
jgi:hypothetical protein